MLVQQMSLFTVQQKQSLRITCTSICFKCTAIKSQQKILLHLKANILKSSTGMLIFFPTEFLTLPEGNKRPSLQCQIV